MRSNLLVYRKYFIEGLLPLFDKNNTPEDPVELEGHISVCKEVLSFFRQFIDKTTSEPELQ